MDLVDVVRAELADLARFEPVGPRPLDLRVAGLRAVIEAAVFRHVGGVPGLAVDRPGGAVVVRRRGPAAVALVGIDDEALFRVGVERAIAVFVARIAFPRDEARIFPDQPLEVQPDVFEVGDAVGAVGAPVVGAERFETVGHGRSFRCAAGPARRRAGDGGQDVTKRPGLSCAARRRAWRPYRRSPASPPVIVVPI